MRAEVSDIAALLLHLIRCLVLPLVSSSWDPVDFCSDLCTPLFDAVDEFFWRIGEDGMVITGISANQLRHARVAR
jgi:hypothetical protein